MANTFFRPGMIEAWGRGIERMMDACQAADVPMPLLRYGVPVERLDYVLVYEMAHLLDQRTTAALSP